MVNEQPEALRLADALLMGDAMIPSIDLPEAAAELRRLHEINSELCRKANTLTILSARDEDKITALEAINQELLEALKMAEPLLQAMQKNIVRYLPQYEKMPALDQARAAIAKAERTTT